jgi:hypothetical protein
MALRWRPIGSTNWKTVKMQPAGRRTYVAELVMPPDVSLGIEYVVRATFAELPPS